MSHLSADGPGTVVISVDAELGWGFHDLTTPPPTRIAAARGGWVQLLDLFDKHELQASWAIVGHLFLEDCDGKHADHPMGPAWFSCERDEWADRPELRFGRSLIERITEATQPHELCNHSFSHVPFGHPETTAAAARAELRASESAAGRSFDSFIFPRNSIGHRDALVDAGFSCYRGNTETTAGGSRSGWVRKLSQVLADGAPLVTPTVDEYGLVNIPASLYLFDLEGLGRAGLGLLGEDPVVRRARRGVDAAARTGKLCHLWLHPNNIRNRRHSRRLKQVFGHIAKRQEGGDIRVSTMGAVAERTLEAQTQPPQRNLGHI